MASYYWHLLSQSNTPERGNPQVTRLGLPTLPSPGDIIVCPRHTRRGLGGGKWEIPIFLYLASFPNADSEKRDFARHFQR